MNNDRVASFFDTIRTRDADAVAQFFAEEGRLVLTDGMEVLGRSSILNFYAKLFSVSPPSPHVKNVIAQGNHVVAELGGSVNGQPILVVDHFTFCDKGLIESLVIYSRKAPPQGEATGVPSVAEKPYPALTQENEFFWTGGKDGELRFKYCNSCQRYIHPPAPYCKECLSNDIGIRVVSGKAHIATYSINSQQWHPAFPPPYVTAMVEIDEAPYVRLTTRIVHCEPDQVQVGQKVRVVFEQAGPAWLPLFEPDH